MEIGEVIYLGEGLYAKYDGFHVVLYSTPDKQVFIEDKIAQDVVDLLKRAFPYLNWD